MKVTLLPVQMLLPGSATMLIVGSTLAAMVIVIVFDVAVGVVAQAELDVITQLTVFPFVRAAFVYVALFVPTFVPFNFHWYAGVVPPFVGVAVNVTLVPLHIVEPGLAAILTDGATDELTVIVTVLDVAVGVDAQAELDVITQLTVFPFVRAAFVYVALFVPTLAPFNFHW